MQIEPSTNSAVGRNLPAPLDISKKDTIQLRFRRSAAALNGTLQFALYNGGQPLAGWGTNNTTPPTTEEEDTVKNGTGYWVIIPDNDSVGVPPAGAWEDLEIPLSNFISAGLNTTSVSGYGIRVTGTVAGATFNRPKYWLDSIIAFNQVDKESLP
jgi:hypothetical protein